MMTLHLEPVRQPCFSCVTPVGMLTIDEIDQQTITISLEDKFRIQVTGGDNACIQLDIDEFMGEINSIQMEGNYGNNKNQVFQGVM